MSDEAWAPIPGWPHYEVSSEGRVRSLDKIVPAKNGSTAVKRGRVLSPVNHKGYLAVRLRDAGRDQTFKIHLLVLEAFTGPRPDGLEARHINGNSLNNSSVNLTWGTRSENNLDRVRHGTHQNYIKDACPQGHRYAGKNLYIEPKTGARQCKICRSNNMKNFYERRKKDG